MTVYVLIVEDHRTDPTPTVFGQKDAALWVARDMARQYDMGYDAPVEGWLFSASCEESGDRLHLVQREVEYGSQVMLAANGSA